MYSCLSVYTQISIAFIRNDRTFLLRNVSNACALHKLHKTIAYLIDYLAFYTAKLIAATPHKRKSNNVTKCDEINIDYAFTS